MIKLELSIEECNMILRVLGKHPFEEVVSVINKIKQQGEPQVVAMEAEKTAETPAA
jgi:calcineurin-like phosphoesterase